MAGDLLSTLAKQVLLGDGAIGTELYARGVFINRCFEDLNASDPDMVLEVHRSYAQAGSQVLTTNTYGANRTRLGPFGLAERLEELNRRGVELAREIAREELWVGGSMGPLQQLVEPEGPLSMDEAVALFAEQARVLVAAGVDILMLETFKQPSMLEAGIQAIRSFSDAPVMASFVAPHAGLEDGEDIQARWTPAQWARRLENLGADVVGTNCVLGPAGVLAAVEDLSRATELPIAAQPNAGYPEQVAGRTLYLASPEYMAEYARRLAQAGARWVGGCCGTTPDMIREMGTYLRSVRVQQYDVVTVPPASGGLPAQPPPMAQRSKLGAWLDDPQHFAISVELSPPRGTNPTRAIESARTLHEAGVDFVNIPDGPRAVPRMNPASLARILRKEVGMESIVHMCCRDRNVLGLQMDLLGFHAEGLHNVLCVTGDPPKMGNHPDATAVFDIDAVGLLRLTRNLNHGLDLGGNALRGSTSFVSGCGVNPGAADLDNELDRLKRKLDAGASYIFSQPVYQTELLETLLERMKGMRQVPFLVGVLPLASLANAEFFHNEVPGMQVPNSVRERLAAQDSREGQAQVGIAIAQETLVQVRHWPGISGAYLFPPFGRVQGVLDVLSVIER